MLVLLVGGDSARVEPDPPTPAGAPASSEDRIAAPAQVELYFEFKLLVRGGPFRGRLDADQWAGGRLLMRGTAAPAAGAGGPAGRESAHGGSALRLVRPLEHPWVFRWYDSKDEVKLGAAVSVPEPRGDPYHELAALLEPLARKKYREWWDGDRVEATAPARPSWAARADRFWSARHREETRRRDPLHDEPVYPFHVLGEPAGRFRFSNDAAGSVIENTIVDAMSEPWLPRGWSEWRPGRRREGYGYWAATGRPAWEPRTYPAIAAALRLLAWSALDEGSLRRTRSLAPGATYERDLQGDGDLAGRIAAVVKALSPRAHGRLDWKGGERAAAFFAVNENAAGRTVVTGETGRLAMSSDPRVHYRVWRHAGFAADIVEHDELQVLVERDRGERFKLWIKIGYRPHDGP